MVARLESDSKEPGFLMRWVPTCHFGLTIGGVLASACLAIYVVTPAPVGLAFKICVGIFLFVLGVFGTWIWLDIILRLISLGMYLSIYGFSSKGLISQCDEIELPEQNEKH